MGLAPAVTQLSCLARLLSAPTFAKKLGERARQDVQANYSLERQIKELNEIYGELVEKKFGGQR